jgi:hypothetical protein
LFACTHFRSHPIRLALPVDASGLGHAAVEAGTVEIKVISRHCFPAVFLR